MEKMTQIKALEIAIEVVEDEAAVEKLTAIKDSLLNKRSKENTKREAQKAENATLAEAIRDFLMEQTDPVNAITIANQFDISTQKVASLIRTIEGIEKGKAEGKVTYKLA